MNSEPREIKFQTRTKPKLKTITSQLLQTTTNNNNKQHHNSTYRLRFQVADLNVDLQKGIVEKTVATHTPTTNTFTKILQALPERLTFGEGT